jgi:O-antigen/teichoic acid export membrane protein
MNIGLRDKVRSSILWSAVQSWVIRFSSLLVFMIIARVLSADQIGLFAAATVVLAFFGMLSEQGLGEAVVQRERVTTVQLNSVFWLNVGTAGLIVAIVWVAAPYIAATMKLPELTAILRVSSLSMPIAASSYVQVAVCKRKFGYRALATAMLGATLAGSAIVLVLVWLGFGVWSLVIQALSAASIFAALMWFKPGWRLSRETDLRSTLPLLGYGMHRLGTYLLDFASTRYVEIFLVSTLGPAALAVYTVGLKLNQAMMQTFSSTILDVAHSGFSRLANDRTGLIAAYYKSISITATVAVPVFCTIAAVAPALVTVLFGSKWAASAEVMRWMAFLGSVQVLQFYNGTVYNAIGRPGIGLAFMVVKVVLTFGALALVRDGNMTALLHAYIFSQLATTPMSFYLVRRLIGVSLLTLLGRIWPMLVASGALVAVAESIQTLAVGRPAWLVLSTAVPAGAVVYLTVLRLTAPEVLRDTMDLLRARRAKQEDSPVIKQDL